MKIYCEVCDTEDIPETEGMQVSPDVWIGGDTTANDHMQLWHPNEWFELDTSELPHRVVLRRGAPTHSPSNARDAQ